jgi:MerR family copper efflux transcriptional regulator
MRVDHASELIACSLSSGEAKDRAQEWARLLERGGAELAPVTDGLRIALRDDSVGTELDGLMAAERECCPFMSMHVERVDGVLTLTVTAPAEAQPLLAELFGVSW